MSADGNLWLGSWWQYFTDEPERTEGVMALSIDATFKESEDNDFCVMQIWQKINDNYYLLDQLRRRMGFVDTLEAVRKFIDKYPELSFVYIEDKANGSAIIDALSREFDGVIPVNPEGGKMARAAAVSYLIENGRVFLPKYATFIDDFLKETAAFPAGKHDDQVDAASQALNRLAAVEAKEIPKARRKYVRYTKDM